MSSVVKRYVGFLCVVILTSSSVSGGQDRTIRGEAGVVRPEYFGMHIHLYDSNERWPPVDFAEWRLWDTGTTWHDLEPQRGVWRFDRLDSLVKTAKAHDKQILLTLGQTPTWASRDPHRASVYGTGASAPPQEIGDWIEYVSQVTNRYRGQIEAYEIWNEPNLAEFYTGDVGEMINLTREAAVVIHRVDPHARIVSPSASMLSGVDWLRRYLEAGGGQYTDVLGYHFYVVPAAPEAMVPLIAAVRKLLDDAGYAGMPIWDTETGWGGEKKTMPAGVQQAFLSRALLLGRLAGLERFYWYAWDNHNWVNLELTTPDNTRPTSAATAFSVTQSQMVDRTVRNCSVRNSTWDCTLVSGNEEEHAVWSVNGKTPWITPPRPNRMWTVVTLDGASSAGAGKFIASEEPRFYTVSSK